MEEEKKDIKKIKELLGRINLMDIDRDEDLMWFLGDLWSQEKHLNQSLNFISEKLKENPNDEYYNKLSKLIARILTETRKQRAAHLPRIQKLKSFALWCFYKHSLGLMMQAGEVASKDVYMALEKEKQLGKMIKTGKSKEEIEKLKKEIEEDWNNAKKGFITSKFGHDTVVLMNQFAKSFEKKDLSKKKQK